MKRHHDIYHKKYPKYYSDSENTNLPKKQKG